MRQKVWLSAHVFACFPLLVFSFLLVSDMVELGTE